MPPNMNVQLQLMEMLPSKKNLVYKKQLLIPVRKSVETQITTRGNVDTATSNNPTPLDTSTPSVDGVKMMGSPRLDLMKIRGDHIKPQPKGSSPNKQILITKRRGENQQWNDIANEKKLSGWESVYGGEAKKELQISK